MTAVTLFGQLGGGPIVADTAAYTLGMHFSLSSPQPLTGIWFYSAPGAAILPSGCCIFLDSSQNGVAGTVRTSASWSGAAGSGWVRCAYDGTVVLSAAVNYCVAVFSAGGGNWYSATSHYWDTGIGQNGLTNVPITAPNSASADQTAQDAFFVGSAGLTYPVSVSNAANYWIDVQAGTLAPVVYQMRSS